MKLIIPILILIIAGGLFFMFTKPTYGEIAELKARSVAYDQALDNARELQAVRDELTAKYNSFSPEDINRIETLLPDTVDSVQLIIDLDDMAQSRGLVFKDTKFEGGAGTDAAKTPMDLLLDTKEYQTSNIGFVVEGSYENFQNFLQDLESSLRLVEIESLSFSAAPIGKTGNFSFQVDLVTYWLRNRN